MRTLVVSVLLGLGVVAACGGDDSPDGGGQSGGQGGSSGQGGSGGEAGASGQGGEAGAAGQGGEAGAAGAGSKAKLGEACNCSGSDFKCLDTSAGPCEGDLTCLDFPIDMGDGFCSQPCTGSGQGDCPAGYECTAEIYNAMEIGDWCVKK